MKFMLKTSLLITIFLFLCSDIIAQTHLSSTSSSPFIIKGRDPLELFQNEDSSYLFMTSGHFGIYATRVTNNLQVAKEKHLHTNFENKLLNYVQTVYFKGDYFVFLSFRNLKLKKTFLFYSVLNPVNLKLSKSLIKVAEMPYGANSQRPVKFIVKNSLNSQYLAIIGLPSSSQFQEFGVYDKIKVSGADSLAAGRASLTYWVMSDKMNIIKQSNNLYIPINHPYKQFGFIDFAIDNSLNIYVLCKNSNFLNKTRVIQNNSPTEEGSKKILWYEYIASQYILTCFSKDDNLHQFVTDSNHIISDLKFSYSPNNIDLVGLTLSSGGNSQNPNGIYHCKLNSNDWKQFDAKVMSLPGPYFNKVVACKSSKNGDVTFAMEKLSFNQTTVKHTKVTRHADGRETISSGISPVYLEFTYGDILIGNVGTNNPELDSSSFNHVIVPRRRQTRIQHPQPCIINEQFAIFPDVIVDIITMTPTKTNPNPKTLRDGNLRITPIYHSQTDANNFLVLNQLNPGFQFVRYQIEKSN
jgi:hypothetical protein